jgi:hypothetical protein
LRLVDYNSMFDFTMYRLAGLVNDLEAAGTRVLLRDQDDKLVILCNDGNYYCNVTNVRPMNESFLQPTPPPLRICLPSTVVLSSSAFGVSTVFVSVSFYSLCLSLCHTRVPLGMLFPPTSSSVNCAKTLTNRPVFYFSHATKSLALHRI